MTTIKLAFLWLKIYSLQIHIKGCDDCLACVADPAYINRIHASRQVAKREIHRLRGLRSELKMRNTWSPA